MRWKTIQVALLIGIAALATEVIAAAQITDGAHVADASASKINMILDRWQVVEANKGGDVALWRDTMSIQLKQVMPATLDRLLALSTGSNPAAIGEFYQTFINTLGTDIALRLQAQNAPAKQVAQAATTHPSGNANAQNSAADKISPQALGSVGSDQTFTPITPCRVVDTRNLGGSIGAFATRNFFFYTSSASTNWAALQGGVNGAAGTVCPGTVMTGFVPSAAVATITVTGQGGNGNLIVWQGTSPVASASTMSYFASGDIAVLAVIRGGGRTGTGPGGAVQDFGVFVNAFTPTNVVVDIVGYYTQPASTALECTQVYSGDVVIPNNSATSANAACPTGYTLTGGGFYISEGSLGVVNDWLWTSFPSSSNIWTTNYSNQTGSNRNGGSYAVCCRVPGR